MKSVAKNLLSNRTCDNCLFRVNVNAVINYPNTDKACAQGRGTDLLHGTLSNAQEKRFTYRPRPVVNTCDRWKTSDIREG